MDSNLWKSVKDIFNNAISLDKDKREEYLDEACGNNDILKNEVKSLIISFERSGEFLNNPDKDLQLSLSPEEDLYLNKNIGPYNIVSVIAEGGMGRVYLGVRSDKEFSQKVAVKVIKYNNRSDYLLQRFQNERQTLANLNHPYIANLLDGGTTADGVPYLVMEYIDGIPLTDYCNTKSLSVEDRLLLFQKICSAVNYAHKNLVVHRDLKPSNILITQDGNPKLLDFGIAKILKDENSTGPAEDTVTQIWNLTPDYASPEQIKGEKITTATDIYSLGVLLYKLLTDRHPYTIKSYLPAEVTRIVCETEPEKPSSIVRSAEQPGSPPGEGNKASEVTDGTNKNEKGKLSKKLAGDLDNIILKAIRKEPDRRYSSIEQFSEDIRRYLSGLPVIARNDTLTYRTSKFVRRHKYGVAAFVTITLLVIAGIAGISWQARIASIQRDKARIETAKVEKINSFLQQMLSSADPDNSGKNVKVVDVLKTAEKKIDNDLKMQPEIRSSVRTTIGITLQNLGLYDDAIIQLKKALNTRDSLYGENNTETAASMENLALALDYKGDYSNAETYYKKSVKIYKELDSVSNPSYAQALNDFGTLYMDLGDYPKAMKNYRTALDVYRKTLGPENSQVASVLNNIALTSDYKGDLNTAEEYYKKALAMDTKILGKNSYELSHMINNLAFILQERGKYNEAISYFKRSLQIRVRILGINHPQCILALYNLGCMYYYVNNFNKSLSLLDSAIALWGKTLPPDHPLFGGAYYWKGKILNSKNQPREAIVFLRKSLKIRERKGDNNKYYTARTECELGRSYMLIGKYKQAESVILKNLKILKGQGGNNTDQVHEVDKILVSLYSKAHRPKEAEKYKTILAKGNSNN